MHVDACNNRHHNLNNNLLPKSLKYIDSADISNMYFFDPEWLTYQKNLHKEEEDSEPSGSPSMTSSPIPPSASEPAAAEHNDHDNYDDEGYNNIPSRSSKRLTRARLEPESELSQGAFSHEPEQYDRDLEQSDQSDQAGAHVQRKKQRKI